MKRIHFDYLKQATEIPRLFLIKLFKKTSVANPKKILIVNSSLIGDILASFPAIRQYIKNNPSCKIDLLITSPLKTLAEKIKGLNKVYIARSISERRIEKKGSSNDLAELLKKEYDQVIVLRLSKDAYKIIKKIKTKSIKSSFREYAGYVKEISNKRTTQHAKQVWQFFFETLNLKPKMLSFDEIFNFTKEDYAQIKKLPEMCDKSKKIIIHTGSGWKLKHWENEKWVELIRKINAIGKFKFIFIGGDEENKDFKQIQSMLDFPIYSLIKKIDLKKLILIMRLSNYFIGIDSGPRNMAYLADTRSIGLIGPGARIFMPYNKKDIIINKSNCVCTASFCLKNPTCMQKIKVDDVFFAFKKLIRNS
jgi:ADP-heptose:LPS heptosyltransferase